MTPQFKEKFETFYIGVQKIHNDYMDKYYLNNPKDTFSYTEGKRFVKIICRTSAHTFVDLSNGDVLKPASWNTPAKHARGNIFDEFNGLKYMTQFGPMYLK